MALSIAPDPRDAALLNDVKAYINPVLGTADDALLQTLLTAASIWIAKYLNRNLNAQTYSEARDGTGTSSMRLLNWPVASVTQVTVDGSKVKPAQNQTDSGYVFNAATGIISLRPGIFGLGEYFSRGFQNVGFVYVAGYNTPGMYALGATVPGAPDLPPSLQMAAMQLSALLYRQRDRVGDTGESAATAGAERMSYFLGALHPSTRLLLDQHREVAPVDGMSVAAYGG
jgi:hypothetical protein